MGSKEQRSGTATKYGPLRLLPLGLLLVCFAVIGCTNAVQKAVRPLYQEAELSTGVTVVRDIPYLEGAQADPEKHRLDLYLPEEPFIADEGSIPVLVFTHGGSLFKGDKDLAVAGLDFYGNIGRFYSARGIAVAVVNYRLQPLVGWREQVEDVAAAVQWVRENILLYGAASARDREFRIYLSGHSAGAWLVSRVSLDHEVRERFDLTDDRIAGVISISGSGFEMTDQRTWELYPKEDWWAERFSVPEPADWKEAASIVPLMATCGCAQNSRRSEDEQLRFLLLYSNQDLPALARQNRLLSTALREWGLKHRMVAVSSESHRRTLLAMSHPQKIIAREILSFIHTNRLDLDLSVQERVVEEIGGR